MLPARRRASVRFFSLARAGVNLLPPLVRALVLGGRTKSPQAASGIELARKAVVAGVRAGLADSEAALGFGNGGGACHGGAMRSGGRRGVIAAAG